MKLLPHLEQKNQDISALLDRAPVVEDSYRSAMFDSFLYAGQNDAESVYQPLQDTVNDLNSAREESKYARAEAESAADKLDEAAHEVAMQSVEEQPQDMQVSREDWNEIKEELEEYGLDKKDIADLEEKVMSENGMTYGQLVSELSGMMKILKGIELTPAQEQGLNSIFAKLGFSPDESKSMLGEIRQGKLGKVIEKMQAKLATMSDSQKLEFSEGETATLSKLFNLSGENGKKLAQLFNTDGTTVGDIKKGFAGLKDAFAKQQQEQDAKDLKLVKSIGDSLRSTMEKASDQAPSNIRMASADVISNSMGAAKDVSESVKQNGQNMSGNGNPNGSEQNNKGNDGNPNSGQNMGEADSSNGQKHWLDKILSDSKSADSWKDFFGKLSDESSIKGEGNLKGNIFGNAMGTLQTAAKSAQAGKASPMWENTARSSVLDQVQEGAFKNLGQGRKQLTLQLNPHNLGSVNVMLQVKNKEVQAVIKAENPDTAKVIAEQLDVVKKALEDQGLKVEKLEVQTGIADHNTQNSWHNAEDHNNSQYQGMMSEMRRRWQVLRHEGASLAQEMQSVEQKATISQGGLYIVT
ncbi:flagellar hook-length control protein FliK [Maridesulfovibrio zosterae]|uniref:flagellar hook-length control protein FliK n=1 Tax=Maridesulfovibrio zosterae TaxID=82171 RepID=UPI000411EBBF|nr:flagellar hook-length control protein FliK [Maridesulfovibrio zosterae]